jgi:hypothetical protein
MKLQWCTMLNFVEHDSKFGGLAQFLDHTVVWRILVMWPRSMYF